MNMKKRITNIVTVLALSFSVSLFANADNVGVYNNSDTTKSLKEYLLTGKNAGVDINGDGIINVFDLADLKAAALDRDVAKDDFTLSSVPAYSGSPYVEINGNVPFFKNFKYGESFEYYSELDELGRCGTTIALLGKDTMPTEKRGEIGEVKPTGWHTVKYDCIADIYLYNRCHLIGYQLAGENANVKNLITGTRYMNATGMEPFESKVAAYIKSTGNHVLYRATPIFEGNNLVAHGVLMEAYSLEDQGAGMSFNVFCYNVQPQIEMDYATGDSKFVGEGDVPVVTEVPGTTLPDKSVEPEITSDAITTPVTTVPAMTTTATEKSVPVTTEIPAPVITEASQTQAVQDPSNPTSRNYVLNTNTKKFHFPGCSSVNQMSAKNRKYIESTREDLIAQGYSPCGKCNP